MVGRNIKIQARPIRKICSTAKYAKYAKGDGGGIEATLTGAILGLGLFSMELTPRAQQALRLAETEARSFGHTTTGSHHLVLGLFLLENGVHFNILKLDFN
jgi:hypothetical protein